ncbi:hypothetical protein JJL52_18835 [Methylomicrobium sp. RS1]|nr:hypothetical protein [Methylomicrobium sp. RS1]
MTNTTPHMTQLQIAKFILRFKRVYRKNLKFNRKWRDEVRHHRRQIKLTADNPFFKHRHSVWQNRIGQLQDALKENQANQNQIQDILVNLIRQFDEAGPASVHVYGAMLSTHHIHVQRALADGAENLMELIVYKVEDGASTADCVSQDAVLHHAVTKAVIRAMQHNKELQYFADNLLQEMVQESLGHPLRQYQIVELPNGQTVAKPMPPQLRVV